MIWNTRIDFQSGTEVKSYEGPIFRFGDCIYHSNGDNHKDIDIAAQVATTTFVSSKNYWTMGEFQEAVIRNYINKWREATADSMEKIARALLSAQDVKELFESSKIDNEAETIRFICDRLVINPSLIKATKSERLDLYLTYPKGAPVYMINKLSHEFSTEVLPEDLTVVVSIDDDEVSTNLARMHKLIDNNLVLTNMIKGATSLLGEDYDFACEAAIDKARIVLNTTLMSTKPECNGEEHQTVEFKL